MNIQKYGRRFFGVYDERGELVCVTVYKKGAQEVVRRLAGIRFPIAAHPPIAEDERPQ